MKYYEKYLTESKNNKAIKKYAFDAVTEIDNAVSRIIEKYRKKIEKENVSMPSDKEYLSVDNFLKMVADDMLKFFEGMSKASGKK